MSRVPLERLRCDRCDDQDIVAEHDRARSNWAQMSVDKASGAVIGDSSGPADLCGACADELVEWFHQPSREKQYAEAVSGG